MNESHVLLWSGGFDSTAILLDMVSKPEQYPNVRVIGCGLKNARNYEEDKNTRIKIASILKIPNSNVSYMEQEIDITASNVGIQLPVWAWLSSINVDFYDKKTSLTFGFIKGDDFWHNKHTFEESVRNLVKLHSDSQLTFEYPLEWKYKKDFINWYIHYSEVFYSLSWGGDTAIIKAKEREELEFLYNEIISAYKLGKHSNDEKKQEEAGSFREGGGI